jgi:hypothetical protein
MTRPCSELGKQEIAMVPNFLYSKTISKALKNSYKNAFA